MFKNLLRVTFIALLLALTSAQLVSKGTCSDNIQVVENFNVENYLGKWYEYAKYPVYFESKGKCISAEYSLNEDGLVDVKNSLVNENSNDYMDILGSASLVDNAKLLVKFPTSPDTAASSNYWVLDTDYENYSVVYSCIPMHKNMHATNVWILTRQPIPEPHFIEKAVNVLKNNNISLNELKITNQISCA